MNTIKGSQQEVLRWEVFVTPGIPVVVSSRPADVQETYFQAMASTLIYGKRDAVLVDAFMTVEQASSLADWIAKKNRNLTTIYITHGHGDHWFGVGTLLERFPNASVVATPNASSVREPDCERVGGGRDSPGVHERVASKRKLESERSRLTAEPIPCARAECERGQAPRWDDHVRRQRGDHALGALRYVTPRVLERRMTSASPDESECPARGMRPHGFDTEEDRR